MSHPITDWIAVDWPAHHRVVEAKGQPIHLVEMGPADAPALLFVHGWTGCWQHWVEQLHHFASDHRVVAIDLPGFGGSPMPVDEITIEAYAATLEGVLDALAIDTATVIGSSMGGGVAAQFALQAPDRVARLVLVAATGLSPRYLMLPAELIRSRLVQRAAGVVLRESRLPSRLAYTLARRPRLRRAALQMFVEDPAAISGPMAVELISGAGRPGAAAAAVALATADLSKHLGEIACPTLVIWGDRDRVVGFSCAQRFAEGIADSELFVFERTGHLPFIERPHDFNLEIRRFVERENGHTRLNTTSTNVTSLSDKIVTH